MNNTEIKFDLQQRYGASALAAYMSQLEREGVVYIVRQDGPRVTVKLTGGF